MRRFAAADNLALRALPPFLPKTLAISATFIGYHFT
jgi:hypothetical protein